MKVEKIKIEKELLEIPNSQSYYKEVTFKDTEIIYEVRKVATGQERNVRNYLVRIDDRKIFDDLIAISDGDLQKNFQSGEKLGKEKMLIEFKSFLQRPWYKRLFVGNTIKSIKAEIENLHYGL